MNAPTDLPGARPPRSEEAEERLRREQEAVASRWELLLPRFSLNRRVTVMVLMLTLGVLGAVATVSMIVGRTSTSEMATEPPPPRSLPCRMAVATATRSRRRPLAATPPAR